MRGLTGQGWRTLVRAIVVGAGLLGVAAAGGCLAAAAGAGAGAGYVAGHEHAKNDPD
jgi:hypothetical protein